MRTYRKHQLAWCRVWRPYCVEHDLDPWAYNMHAAADCLSRVQERSKEYAAANGTKEQHSSFKEARAAITAFWRLVHPHTNLAEEPAIKDMAVGLRRTAPLLRRYDDTWDIAAIFMTIFKMRSDGVDLCELPHHRMRPWLALLLKLRTSCRSGDVAPGAKPPNEPRSARRGGICRGWHPIHRHATGVRMGLRGSRATGTVSHVRFPLNKTVGGQASHYSKWFKLGAYLQPTEQYPLLPAACPRRLLEAYVRATQHLDRWDDYLLVSNSPARDPDGVATGKKHFGVSASTVAGDVQRVMRACGVPERFLAHSTRHASLNKRIGDAGDAGDTLTVLSEASLSSKVFNLFYFQPIVGCEEMAIEAAADKARLELQDPAGAAKRRRTTATVTAASGSALAAAESSSLVTAGAGGEDAGVFTVRAILDRHGEGAGAQYLVHWDGYTRDEATWEPAAHLTGAREAVGHYERAREARAAVSERRLAVLAPSRARPTRTQSATRG